MKKLLEKRGIVLKLLKMRKVCVCETEITYYAQRDDESICISVRSEGKHGGYFFVSDVTCSSENAEQIVDLLADNAVFPQNAAEILEDIFGSENDFLLLT